MKDENCIFCKIAGGEVPAEKLYEDERVVAFEDVRPAAPVHFLVIPREHIATLDDAGPEHSELLGHMLVTAARIAREKGVADDGYRQVVNCRKHGGQIVFHLHMHVLGGKQLRRMG
ncbi:MAG: histidine triad nucleotide-binding protein [Polyangia bacterium]